MTPYELADELDNADEGSGYLGFLALEAAPMLRQQADRIAELEKHYSQEEVDKVANKLRKGSKDPNKWSNMMDEAMEMILALQHRIAELEKALMLAGETKWDIVKDGKIIESNYTHPVKQLENGYFLPMNVLNEPMQKSIKALIDHAKKGRWSNAIVRQDGVETTYEADWIKSLVPVFHPVKQLSDEEIANIWAEHTKVAGTYDVKDIIFPFARAIIKEITE